MRRVVSYVLGCHARVGYALALCEVGEEPPDPVRVAALGAIRVVTDTQSLPELFQCRERTGVAALVEDGAGRFAVPVGPLQKVDEVDAEGVLRLTDLPLFPAALALEVLAESAYLVGHGFVGRGEREEAADPSVRSKAPRSP